MRLELDEVKKYGKEQNFSIDIKDTEKIILTIEDSIIVPMDEASFDELRNKLNEAYELRKM
ncbi:hypothetical protein I6E45_02960 [Clostridium perfringens]|uniref:Uncharacterized protein n=1 Tax=Clostridium perfringens TaxID=1502 RepID=A0A2X3AGA6_CLOPF|nr:hypothetical protein [Clostridium perfringens]AXH51925.1 hypothetical protein C8114_04670 [Clostridium perfringens]MBI6069237.1 hypothetical protein [Clostridium perfringens]MBI6096474.1 hypothetical protein [Clostridium perfringens]MCF2685024.1 hypothetical protein [Clostridium perfringens]SQB61599.1 Uncharacterised protein [Clostridium perfringens]